MGEPLPNWREGPRPLMMHYNGFPFASSPRGRPSIGSSTARRGGNTAVSSTGRQTSSPTRPPPKSRACWKLRPASAGARQPQGSEDRARASPPSDKYSSAEVKAFVNAHIELLELHTGAMREIQRQQKDLERQRRLADEHERLTKAHDAVIHDKHALVSDNQKLRLALEAMGTCPAAVASAAASSSTTIASQSAAAQSATAADAAAAVAAPAASAASSSDAASASKHQRPAGGPPVAQGPASASRCANGADEDGDVRRRSATILQKTQRGRRTRAEAKHSSGR